MCELKRSLYGLKVSPKRWYLRFTEVMKNMMFEIYPFQSTLFIWREREKFAILLLYVDDILLTSNCETKMEEIKNELLKEFELSDLGEPKKFLGIEITKGENGSYLLHQHRFIETVLNRFGMNNAKAKQNCTPMITNDSASKAESDIKLKRSNLKEIPYRQAIGSLLYLSNGTRPDITYAVNVLSRKQSNFNQEDWAKVKRVLRYLNNTKQYGLSIKGCGEGITCYPDASLGISDEKGESTSGYAIFLFGDLISWRTKKQIHVSLSSAEAEFVAMSLACRELANVSEMSKRLVKTKIVPIVYEDNKAATEESTTLKHLVNLCYHYVRFEARCNSIKIEWIRSDEQIGDFFTKALANPKFKYFRSKLMGRIH